MASVLRDDAIRVLDDVLACHASEALDLASLYRLCLAEAERKGTSATEKLTTMLRQGASLLDPGKDVQTFAVGGAVSSLFASRPVNSSTSVNVDMELKDVESKEEVLAAAMEAAAALAEEAASALAEERAAEDDSKREHQEENQKEQEKEETDASRDAFIDTDKYDAENNKPRVEDSSSPAGKVLAALSEEPERRKRTDAISAASKAASQRLERAQARMVASIQSAQKAAQDRGKPKNSDSRQETFSSGTSSMVGAAAAKSLAAMKKEESKNPRRAKEATDTSDALEGSGNNDFGQGLDLETTMSSDVPAQPATETSSKGAKWLQAWRQGGVQVQDHWYANTTDPQGRGITADCLVANRDVIIFPGHDGDASIVSVYSVRAGSMLRCLKGHTDTVCCVASEKDVIATGSKDQAIRLWNGRSGDCTGILEGSEDAVHGLAMRGDWLLSGEAASRGARAKARLWSIKKAECVTTFSEHVKSIWSVALGVSPTLGNVAITGSHDTSARVWSLDGTNASRATFPHPHFIVSSVSVEGGVAATGCGDGHVRLWSLQTFACIRSFAHHGSDGPLRSMAGETHNPIFSVVIKDGLLASGGHEKTIKVWTLDGECIATMNHGAAVRGLAISPLGFIASSGGKVGAIIWEPAR